MQLSAILDFDFLYYCVKKKKSKLSYKIIINFCCSLIIGIVAKELYDMKSLFANKLPLEIVKICESLGQQKLFSGWIIKKRYKQIHMYIFIYSRE